MIAHNPVFSSKFDVLWGVAAFLLAFNLLNTLAWAFGFYLHPVAYCVAASLILLEWRKSNMWVLFATISVFVVITLGSSIAVWDARSIWFFHAKRIFFDATLYAQLDKYPGWSHSDYPTLFPALAASVARAFGYWNETLPKLAVVLILTPALLFFASAFRTASFNFLLAGVLIVCGSTLLNGNVDAILALYCAAASVLLAKIYCNAFDRVETTPCWYLNAMFALFLANILLLKNEGLLAALMLWVCWLPHLYSRPAKSAISQLAILSLPFIFYFFVWKLPLINNQITGDTFLPGMQARLFATLSNADDLIELTATFARICGFYIACLALIVAFSIRQKMAIRVIPIAVFICGYWAALFVIYLMSPHGLTWILATSADRTWMVPNLCVVALGIYALGSQRLEINHTKFA